MSSVITTLTTHSSGGKPTKEFHCFPDLPAELRIRIWQMAYDRIPDTLVYRFELQFFLTPDSELSDDDEETEEAQAFLSPLKEMRHLTRELRSLRRVNTESRYEGDRLFDSYLQLNQTEEGCTTELCPPINLPFKADRTFFCFVGLTESTLACLEKASTALIDQVLSTIRLLGLGVDRELEDGLTDFGDYSGFAEFILLFTEVHHVALVSDRLMSEADLDNINDDLRSSFILSCWDDWVGRVQEDVIGFRYDKPKITTQEEHLEAMEEFAGSMLNYGEIHSEFAGKLWEIGYGMVFRTEQDFGYLLLDDETWEELFGEEMGSDVSSDGMPGLLSEGSDDA